MAASQQTGISRGVTVATSDDDRDTVVNRLDAFPNDPFKLQMMILTVSVITATNTKDTMMEQ